MTKIRTPRSTPAAQQLLERYAALDSVIAESEAARSTALAAVNAGYDAEQTPVLVELAGRASWKHPQAVGRVLERWAEVCFCTLWGGSRSG